MNYSHLLHRFEGWLKGHPWAWIPTAFLAKGVSVVSLTVISVLAFKRLGLDNAMVCLLVAMLYLPWLLRPLVSPLVLRFMSLRRWIVLCQLGMAVALFCVAWNVSLKGGYMGVMLWLVVHSVVGVVHDAAVDKYFRMNAPVSVRRSFGGITSVFFRVALLFGQGILLMVVGNMETLTRDVAGAWRFLFHAMAFFFLLLAVVNLLLLPKPAPFDEGDTSPLSYLSRGMAPVKEFFSQKGVVPISLFLLLFLLPEQLVEKVGMLFLVDAGHTGGLALSPQEFGFVQGTIGVFALSVGGVLGGMAVHRHGVGRWLWPMALAFTLTNVVYLFLAAYMPTNIWLVSLCMVVKFLGLGFGTTAYAVNMIAFSRDDSGEMRTERFAVCSSAMALATLLFTALSGYLQEWLGYYRFFWLVLFSSFITWLVTFFVKVDGSAGKKV
ncbi:MAG: hypothetical protein IKT00_09375 [Prevotella sp.]|nr:hypothetical protein [Prevotella sp.]